MAAIFKILKYWTQLQIDLRYEKIDPNYAKKSISRMMTSSMTSQGGLIAGPLYSFINEITTFFIITKKTSKHIIIKLPVHRYTRDSEVIMFSPCVFICLCVVVCLCLSRCLSGRFNYEGLVPHKQYFAGTLLGMSSCASYVSRTHDVIDDVTRSQSRSKFEIDISPWIFELQRRSTAQYIGNAHGYPPGIFNFRYNFRSKWRPFF